MSSKAKILTAGMVVVVYAGLVSGRLAREGKEIARGGYEKAVIGSKWDPRDYEKVQKSLRRRESDAFRNRLISGNSSGFTWPGLASAQISWTWLSLLQAVHYDSSYDSDFSWMFSKIFFIVAHAHPAEVYFARSLAPFYFVIGKDHPGANMVLEEIMKRNSNEYQIFFWGGFHGLYNLFSRKMAAWMYRESARRPGAPQYIAALSYKLEYGEDVVDSKQGLTKVLEKETDPKIMELIKKSHPDWFKDDTDSEN